MNLPSNNQEELDLMITMNGEVKARALYATMILSDVQEILATNPSQANIWVNHAKIVLSELVTK